MLRYTSAVVLLAGSLGLTLARGPAADDPAPKKIEPPKVADDSGKRPDLAKVAERIVEQTNEFRKKEGRGPVKANPKLADTAKSFAAFMAEKDLYGHTADGSTPADRAKTHEYDYCLVLENIAYAFDSLGFEAPKLADQFVTGWKESPGHRKNMLDPDATETGVAVARSEATGHYYAVQMFGRPKSAAIEFKVENKAGEEVAYTLGDQKLTLPAGFTRTHTVCRPAELTFPGPGGKGEPTTVKPAAGDKLVVTRDGDKFVVKKE
ncbi:MAG: CAP domain-containing protein [Gemmataceae bacterium]|nr:CAP domain-containing protein [Gemmataceae bacterium]